MPREAVEYFGGDVLDSNGDVKPDADYRDALGNFIELPDEPAVEVPTATLSESSPERPLAEELTPLERAQREWDDRFDEFDNNAPSTDIARERMIQKYGPRPEAPAQTPAEAAERPVITDKQEVHGFVRGVKEASLQRQLDEVDANPRLRPEQKESEKLLIRARFRAREQVRQDQREGKHF